MNNWTEVHLSESLAIFVKSISIFKSLQTLFVIVRLNTCTFMMNNWTEVQFYTNFEGIYSLQINFQNNPKIDLESTENAYFPYYFLHSIRADDRNFRRFFINHLYAGCAKDIGWLVVAENLRPRCSWEKNGEIPVIKYATGHTKENWTYGKVKFADAILIFVKVYPVSPFVVFLFCFSRHCNYSPVTSNLYSVLREACYPP